MMGPGQSAPPRFEVLREVGAGGEGRVLAVRDRARGGALLALKETHGPRADALRREFDTLARLSHPALVRVYDWLERSPVDGSGLGRAAYTQDWIEGRDLGAVARDLDASAREEVMLALLGALAHLHAAGVAHLDLKPDNVLVDAAGAPFLVDFGIAARLGSRPEVVRGSRSYVAPEILAGGAVAPSADLWAYGRILSELGVAPEVALALAEPDPAARPASALAVARLWSRARRRPVDLFPRAWAPALVRSGGRVGHEAELTRAAAMSAVVVTGPAGSGRRTFVKALSYIAGAPRTELWPLGGSDAVEGLLEALARLVPEASPLPPVPAAPATTTAGAGWSETLAPWAAEATRRLVAATAGGAPRLLGVLAVEPPRAARALLEALVAAVTSQPAALRVAWACASPPQIDGAIIVLPPFDRDSGAAFVRSRFGPALARDDGLVAALVAASGGRPGHMEALAELMVARGDLAFDEAGWVAARTRPAPGDLRSDLPSDLGAAIAARVSLLPPELGRALGALAALRFPVGDEAIAAALDAPVAACRATLRELVAAGLARVLADRWEPAHPGLLAHATLLDDRARERVLAAPGLDPRARALVEGGEAGAARLAAWARAALGRAPEDAEAAAELALALDNDHIEALAARAAVADLLGPRDRQRAVLERLVAGLARTPGEGARELAARADLFWTLTRIGDAAATLAEGPALAERARAEGATRLSAEVRVHVAIAATQRGEHDLAERELEAAASLARELGEVPEALALGARIANNLGNVHAFRGRHAQALEAYRAALRLKVAEGDPVGERIATGNLGLTLMQLGRFGDAREHLLASLALARRTGHRRGEAWSLLTLAELGLEGAAWGYTVRMATRASEIATALGDGLVAGDAHVTRAEALLGSGDHAAARAAAELGRERASLAQSAFTAARAELVLALAEPDTAAPELLASLAAREDADAGTRRTAALELARRLVATGDLRAAADAIARAMVDSDRIDLRWIALADLGLALARSRGEGAPCTDLAARLEGFLAAWPAVPSPDPDGPCQATARHHPAVRALAERVRGMPRGLAISPRAMDPSASRQGSLASPGLLADSALALETPGQLEQALAGELAAAVRATGAERGFLCVWSGEAAKILAARDADGEPLTDAAKRLPESAVLALRSGDPSRPAPERWRGADGRGATLALAWRVPVGGEARHGALVLQNRFVPTAFEDAAPAASALAALAVPLRLYLLESALAELRQSVASARAEARALEARTTEEIRTLRRELETTREQLGPAHDYPEIIFRSGAMKKMLRQVDRVLTTDLPIHIHGESGTGKELVARAIHQLGPRARGPFVAQNCTAIPPTLFESELFGHERGAFTGAHRATEGLFRRAHQGTLFLDEIGDLPLELQAKLLRVLETGEVRPVGATRSVEVDVRIVSATHRDLADLITRGAFREDLYYRLNVIRIDVPPLRDRPDDIPVLIEHFLARRAASPEATPRLDDAALRACVRFAWPGNVRQLENEITRASLLAESGLIRLHDLSADVQAGGPAARPAQPGAAPGAPVASAAAGAAPGAHPLKALGLDHGALKDRIARLELMVLEAALHRARNNKSEVARELGLSRAGLNLKLKRLGLWTGADDDGADEGEGEA